MAKVPTWIYRRTDGVGHIIEHEPGDPLPEGYEDTPAKCGTPEKPLGDVVETDPELAQLEKDIEALDRAEKKKKTVRKLIDGNGA